MEGPFKGLLPQNSQQPCEVGAILQSYKLEILGPETSNIFPNTVQSGNKCHNQLSSETVRCHIFPGSQTPPGDQTFGDLGTPANTFLNTKQATEKRLEKNCRQSMRKLPPLSWGHPQCTCAVCALPACAPAPHQPTSRVSCLLQGVPGRGFIDTHVHGKHSHS